MPFSEATQHPTSEVFSTNENGLFDATKFDADLAAVSPEQKTAKLVELSNEILQKLNNNELSSEGAAQAKASIEKSFDTLPFDATNQSDLEAIKNISSILVELRVATLNANAEKNADEYIKTRESQIEISSTVKKSPESIVLDVKKQAEQLINKFQRFSSFLDRDITSLQKQYEALGLVPNQSEINKLTQNKKTAIDTIDKEILKALPQMKQDVARADQAEGANEVNHLLSQLQKLVDRSTVVEGGDAIKIEAANDNVELEPSNLRRIEFFKELVADANADVSNLEQQGQESTQLKEKLKNQLIDQLVDSIADRTSRQKSVRTIRGALLDVTAATKQFRELSQSDLPLTSADIQQIRTRIFEKIAGQGIDTLSTEGLVGASGEDQKNADNMVEQINQQLLKIA